MAEITAYFHEEYGVVLSSEEAQRYLDSLTDLYRRFQRSINAEAVPPRVARERPRVRHGKT